MFITRHNNPYELKGELPTVGEKAPHFSLECIHGEIKTPESFAGSVTLISVVPDINTRVCDIQTKAFHKKMKEHPSIQLVTISKITKMNLKIGVRQMMLQWKCYAMLILHLEKHMAFMCLN